MVDVSVLISTAQIITQEVLSVIRKFLKSRWKPGVSENEAISKNVAQAQNYHQNAKEKHHTCIDFVLITH
jgi:hypothetical protein